MEKKLTRIESNIHHMDQKHRKSHLQSQTRKDHLLDYVKQGKNSYAIAASFDYGEYRPQVPVLKKLSEEFELCLYGLNVVRKEMDGLRLAA